MILFKFSFSIDICQFNMTSLFNSSEDKTRSMSFRSVILIMIYAGTIILNLLAASVDNTFPIRASSENSTFTQETVKEDSVSIPSFSLGFWYGKTKKLYYFRVTTTWYIYGTHFRSLGVLAQLLDG